VDDLDDGDAAEVDNLATRASDADAEEDVALHDEDDRDDQD
jgi:hypothetical protein